MNVLFEDKQSSGMEFWFLFSIIYYRYFQEDECEYSVNTSMKYPNMILMENIQFLFNLEGRLIFDVCDKINEINE